MEKKGALSVTFLVMLILAIGGFIILLYFVISSFGEEDFGSDNVCRLSVLTRASISSNVRNYVPLKCTPSKICITRSLFGKCEQFAGEKNVKSVVLPSDDNKAARKIEEINAVAKFNCWEMMGQGKVDIVGDFLTNLGMNAFEPTCVICSRIAIDLDSFSEFCDKKSKKYNLEKCMDELGKGPLKSVDINRYLETHNIPGGSITYAQYFSGRADTKLQVMGQPQLDKLKEQSKNYVPNSAYIENELKKIEEESFERAYVFSQVINPKIESVLSDLARAGVGVFLGATSLPIVGRAVFSPYVLVPGLIIAGGTAAYAAINTNANIEAVGSYCGEFQSSKINSDKSVGCSVIQGIPYDYRVIKAMCKSVQGNP